MGTIGIIGDYNPEQETHRATDDALQHAARALGTPLAASWISTLDLGETG